MKGFLKNKRGTEGILFPIIIRVILAIIFFGALLLFVYDKATDSSFYEQAYAKKIALLLNEAKPVSMLTLNFAEGVEFAEKNKIPKSEIVKIENNEVSVRLSRGGGYSISYFSDYEVSNYFDNENLIIIVNEK